MHIFHDWHYVNTTDEVLPPCGPYDPRDEERRTVKYDNFICCTCGQTKKRDYYERFAYMG